MERRGPAFRYRAPSRGEQELSRRELEALLWVSHGLTYEMVGDVMGVGLETVKTHLMRARFKLAAKNTPHAIGVAFRLGLLQ